MNKSMTEIERYQEVGTEVYNKLRLLTCPIGIRFIKDVSEIPENAQRPSKMGGKISLCQAFTYARRWGATVAMTFEDNVCVTSSFVHQWERLPNEDLIESQIKSGYCKDRGAALRAFGLLLEYANNENYIERLKDHIGMLVAPLTR